MKKRWKSLITFLVMANMHSAMADLLVDNFENGFGGSFNADGSATMELTGSEGVTQGSQALKINLPEQLDASRPRQRANLVYTIDPAQIDWSNDSFRMDVLVMGVMPFTGIYLLTNDGYRVAYVNNLTGGVELAMSEFNPEGGGVFSWDQVRQIQISFFSNPGSGGCRIILDQLLFAPVNGPDYSNLYYVEN